MRKAFAAAGAAPDTLATLVDRRLLRIEERLDMRRVELTHDEQLAVVAVPPLIWTRTVVAARCPPGGVHHLRGR